MSLYQEKITQIQYSINYIPRYNKEFNDAMFNLMAPNNSLTVLASRTIPSECFDKLQNKFIDESKLDYIEDDIYGIKYAYRDFNTEYLDKLLEENKYDALLSIILI